MNRREFLQLSAASAAGFALPGLVRGEVQPPPPSGSPPRAFKISLAQWSLHNTLEAKKLDHLDFPRVARRTFGIDTVEYVDQFFADKARDTAYLGELKRRCESEGVRSGLIMVDTAGELAGPDAAARARAVEKHQEWIDAARFLGCHTTRVNAWGEGSPADLKSRIVESAGKLAEHGAKVGVNVVIENHGGTSSDGEWLADVMRQVNSPWFGTLPDFGNFPTDKQGAYLADKYRAVERWMPFAKAVSAKTERFDAAGNCLETDYPKMMKIVLDAGYRGYVGIESEVEKMEEEAPAIRYTSAILEKILAAQPKMAPLFNGRDLSGWIPLEGGQWTVEDGTLVGRKGRNWSTDPSRAGSWLRTEKEYGDFELQLEFMAVTPRTNSGVFIRSALERNPAFTGYEVQIFDAAGAPPSKGGPGSLYDYAAPSKNLVRPAGEWNEYRVIARGERIIVHVNGQMVIDVKGDRARRGYVGLQNHDEKSEIRFRNLYLAEL